MAGPGDAALADGDGEGRPADGPDKRTAKRFAQRRRCRFNDEANGRRRRLGDGCLPQQKQRPSGIPRPCVQPLCRGEIELPRIAADFENGRHRFRQPRCFLGDPQRVDELFRLAKQQHFGFDSEHGPQPPGAGKTRLPKDFRRTDPQDGSRRFARLQHQAGKSQHEAGNSARIAGFHAVDLGQRSLRQAAAKSHVEAFDAGEKNAIAAGIIRTGRRLKALGQRPFDLRDLAAQGKNGSPRHGTFGHDGSASSKIVPVMFL